jgi:hypothetical protein
VSVQRGQASIQRGQNATYVVEVSAENGSAADVSVALTSKPSSQKHVFISGCAKGEKKASCTVSSVTDKKSVSLDAQVPVAVGATSVSSVTLTATASIVTSAKWTPPAAGETVEVISASASAATPSASAPAETVLPLGPIPSLNGVSSSLIGAGNASSLFPAIVPSDTPSPSPSPGVNAQIPEQNAAPDADSSTPAPVLPAQVAGLIALALGIVLTVTRLSLRKRLRSPKRSARR